jgi:hypothetical protein
VTSKKRTLNKTQSRAWYWRSKQDFYDPGGITVFQRPLCQKSVSLVVPLFCNRKIEMTHELTDELVGITRTMRDTPTVMKRRKKRKQLAGTLRHELFELDGCSLPSSLGPLTK